MRRGILFLAACMILINGMRLFVSPLITPIFSLDEVVALAGFIFGVMAVISTWHPLSYVDMRKVYLVLGIVLVGAAGLAINSPTLGTLRHTYLPIADIFVMLESGILLCLVGTEKAAEEAMPPFALLSMATQLIWRRYASQQPLQEAPAPALSTAKTAH